MLAEEKNMSINWQDFNKSEDRSGKSSDMPQAESALKVIKVLQRAGFCIYPSDNGDDDLIFIVPVTTSACFPHSLFSSN
jgi:hypothetical protein